MRWVPWDLATNAAIAVLVLLCTTVPVRAGPVTDAADQVLAAFNATETKALKALAEKDKPDPWLVADELCFRGEHDAARAFAKAAPRKGTGKLPAYVASRIGKRANREARTAVAAVLKAYSAKDYEAALAALEGVRTAAGEVMSARVPGWKGFLLESLGRPEEGAAELQKAAEAAAGLGWLAREAMECGALANIHLRLGAYAKALDYQARSLKLEEQRGNRTEVARALGNIGIIHMRLGAYAKALEYHERAVALAAEFGSLETDVTALWNLAATHLRLGEFEDAARAARRGVAKLPLLVGGLADEQGATARDRWTGLLENGIEAGMLLGDPGEVSFFLESGRAGALLESLGNRESVGGVVLPSQLREKEIAARAAVRAAQARHGRALKAGKRKEIRAARVALEDSRGKVLDVVVRIQRAAKAAADMMYPKAAPLREIQGALAVDEALVLYALFRKSAMALVVTRKESRIVRLAKLEETLRLEDPKKPWEQEAARLRKAVVEPLGLGKETKRLLVSPAGALSYVPFGVLAPDREVVYVPSGTTYTVLLDERAKRGKEVLALGDPDYGGKRDAGASSIYRSGDRGVLTPLPGTRAEAKAVGDVLLLGRDASEARLKETLTRGQRRRAVHLACHGLVNAERPQLSSLALTPDDKNDGFLTVLEVFQMKIPADLVVLSACETARGKVHRAEGIVGFTRAFMFAGAPRVIVSLWKVDDDATRVLMVKFYALWNPKDDSKGLPTATALKKAQEFVASHKKWRHPYYWAAWQLWGLGD